MHGMYSIYVQFASMMAKHNIDAFQFSAPFFLEAYISFFIPLHFFNNNVN